MSWRWLSQPAPPAEDPVAATARDMATAAELMEPVREAMSGYRAQLLDDGFSPETAERMTADYHAGMLRVILR